MSRVSWVMRRNFALGGDRANGDGHRCIAAIAAQPDSAINGDDIAVLEHAVARDAVDDFVVDADAGITREAFARLVGRVPFEQPLPASRRISIMDNAI